MPRIRDDGVLEGNSQFGDEQGVVVEPGEGAVVDGLVVGDPVAQLVEAREPGVDRLPPSLTGEGAVEPRAPEGPLVAAGQEVPPEPEEEVLG